MSKTPRHSEPVRTLAWESRKKKRKTTKTEWKSYGIATSGFALLAMTCFYDSLQNALPIRGGRLHIFSKSQNQLREQEVDQQGDGVDDGGD
ncbi:MAG: hypothetical protein IJO05_04845, partial [Oscillospiraceae bacterium]|nr:hypothetical protein [Oscillospiraceae bacterium]